MITIYEAAKAAWLPLIDTLRGSVLYVDDGAAEIIATGLGLEFLLGMSGFQPRSNSSS